MFLQHLALHQFRHFEGFDFTPGPGCNFIFGPNGSGKSSLLEAIYVVAMGRSFRSTQLNALIRHQSSAFSVIAGWQNVFERQFTVGFGRKQAVSDIRLNGQAVSSLRDLVSLVPVQLINHECFHLLDAGPQSRREFLDWGVFHTEPSFYLAWQRYQRALKQRNAALKRRLPAAELALWDQELSEQASVIHALRQSYLNVFLPYFNSVLAKLLAIEHLVVHYQPGWDVEQTLAAVFKGDYERDSLLGHTQHGPHRADLKIKVNNIDADHLLSRGQQKLVSYALRLAQSDCLQQSTGKKTVFLIDDLAAELDADKIKQVLSVLQALDCQFFITGVDAPFLLAAAEALPMFHVEHLR